MGKTEQIGRAELEILRYVQDHSPAPVRQVAEHFAVTKGHVRTTILTVLERLRKKGYLKRRKVDGLFHYSPSTPKASMLQRLVTDFVDKTLGGSVSPFVAYLVNDARLSQEELNELKRLVHQLEQQQKEGES
jgi:predicted transcriptional regulator